VPHLNLFCAFGRLQGGVPRTFEHAQRESREKYTFCNVQHLSRWCGVLARVSGWYRVDCRLAGLCISFTIGWLNDVYGCICFRAFRHCQTMVLRQLNSSQSSAFWRYCHYLRLTVRVCYYMSSLQSLDEWQSLPNFAPQTTSDDECCEFAKESSWWLVSFVLCLNSRLSPSTSTVSRAPLLQRSFCGCLPSKWLTLRQSKILDNEFLVSKQRRVI
jgi:hypothetical protein